MDNPTRQAMVDAETWFPVAFLSFIEEPDGAMILHQMWVSALGETKWRRVETRNLQQMVKAYAECRTFNADDSDAELENL